MENLRVRVVGPSPYRFIGAMCEIGQFGLLFDKRRLSMVEVFSQPDELENLARSMRWKRTDMRH